MCGLSEATAAAVKSPPRNREAWLAGICIFAFVVRVAAGFLVVRSPDRAIWPDSSSYISLAENLLSGAGYRSTATAPLDLIRTPGYPVFLAGVFALLGKSYVAVVMVQLGLGAGVGLALWWAGKRILSTAIGLAAALIYALTPNAALWALAVLSDVLFAFVLALALVPFVQCFRRGGLGWFFLTGLLLGISALVRPVGAVLIPVWGVAAGVWIWRQKRAWRSALVAMLVFLVAAGIPTLPWAVGNDRAWGVFALSSIDTWNLGHYQAPAALAHAQGISLEAARQEVPTSRVPQPGDDSRYLQILLDHPVDYAIVHAQGTWLVLSEAGQPNLAQLLGEHYRGSSVVHSLLRGDVRGAYSSLKIALADATQRWLLLGVGYGLLFEAATYLLAALGILKLARARGAPRWVGVSLAASAVLFILIPGPVGNSRFRVPAEPFLCLLSAAALPWWRGNRAAIQETGQA